jgi:sterol desaturase/sphingolipid hydroxylase (fatty acid hydroxylase superfamily)
MATVKVKGSAKLFDNKILNALTRTHPAIILAMYIPTCAFLLWYFHNHVENSIGVLVLVFFIGVFSWTFFEYILHRYVFHFVNDTKWAQRMHYYIHGAHHEYPKDKQRLVMPPVPSIIIAGSFFIFFRLLMGGFSFAFFSGFMIGYLCYAMIHYSMHAFRPPKNFTKFAWEYHNIHHFRHPDKAYGVSSPFWDIVFGTYPPKKPSSNSSEK